MKGLTKRHIVDAVLFVIWIAIVLIGGYYVHTLYVPMLLTASSETTEATTTEAQEPETVVITVVETAELSPLYEELDSLRSRVEELEAMASVEASADILNQAVAEYPTAAIVYGTLRTNGYSDKVICAILGNMMVECGYSTLGLYPYVYGTYESIRYYGLCQWSYKYHKSVHGASILDQIEYLMSTMEHEFNTYGYRYRKGFTYEEFLNLDSVADMAEAFAICYERCGSGSYQSRRICALEAYEYFVR